LKTQISLKKKKAKILFDASDEGGLKVNAEENKYMLMSCYQNAGQKS